MTLVPLKLPPGIVRPGTRYDAKGRWYDANLIRWHDQAMQPVGGWQVLERTNDVAVTAALSDDGGVFTNETTDANSAGANDVVLIPATPQASDAFYVGYTYRFSSVKFNVGTAGTGNTITWEYYNGSAWVALSGVSDNTNSFRNSGTNTVSFTLPWNWSATSVNSVGPYYYVRGRVTGAGSTTALGTQVWISVGPVDVDAAIRSLMAWKANDNTPQLFIGTPAKAFNFSGGVLSDITPGGFTTGGTDATLSTSTYGSGAYGSGPYGTGDVAQATLTEANTWQVDTFGEDVVACAYSDGKIWTWDKSVGGAMTQVTNAPTSCKGVVVTPERFVVALAAGGDARLIQWSDQEALTTWTTTAQNQAGDYTLPGSGALMAGRRGKNETLLWTDVDFFVMSYIGAPFVYSFQQRGSHCGPISRNAMGTFGGSAMWMGQKEFYVYDGTVKSVACDVADYVFSDINRVQASKVVCFLRSEYSEIVWHYPSASATEIDRYVVYNFKENYWNIGTLQRTAGADRDAFLYPLAADASGVVYQHEVGTTYLNPSGTAMTPYAESGPIEIADGDQIMNISEFVPDEKTLGDASVYIYSAPYPTSTEVTNGPYTLSNPTSVRASGRQVRVKVSQVRSNWRYGTPRIDVTLGGRR